MAKLHLGTSCAVAVCLLAVGAIAQQDRARKVVKESGETTAADVDVPKKAVAVLLATKGNQVGGSITLMQTPEGVRLRGLVSGLKPGLHGFHIHEFGDLRAPDGKSAGGHFNPEGVKHGGPQGEEHHVGDLGNIDAGENGAAKIDVLAKGLKLHYVIGRSIVVHGGADDLKSQPSGDAGARVAVGVIGFAGPMEDDAKEVSAKTKR